MKPAGGDNERSHKEWSKIPNQAGSEQLLNPAPNASLEPTGFYESSRRGRLFDDHLGIFGQQEMIEFQTSEAQGRRILMFIIHNIKLLLDIFRDADPSRRWANKRGSARGRGNSVNRRKRSCRCALPPEKTIKSRGFFGPAIKLRTTKSQIVGGVALGNFVGENQVAVLSFGTVNK